MKKTYIVIPQYIVNEELEQLAKDSIASFREHSPDAIIISVEDGTKSKFLEEISDIYLKNEKNEGFAKTCNKGFRWIFENEKDDCYIVCSNNDILLREDWHREMVRPFKEFDNVAVTGLISTRDKELYKTFEIPKITEGGLLNDRMQNGGLWMSKKSILEKIAIYKKI